MKIKYRHIHNSTSDLAELAPTKSTFESHGYARRADAQRLADALNAAPTSEARPPRVVVVECGGRFLAQGERVGYTSHATYGRGGRVFAMPRA